MAEVVKGGDWYESTEKVRVDGGGGNPAGIERECEEPDGYVQHFPRDFVPVYEATPVAVDGDETQGRGRAAKGAPVRRGGGGGGSRREVAVDAPIGWLFRGGCRGSSIGRSDRG